MCRVRLDSLYLGGIQRDLVRELNMNEEKEVANAARAFTESLLFSYVFNEEIKKYAEVSVCKHESDKVRNGAADAINIILQLENSFKALVEQREEAKKEFDQYNPL